MKTIQWRKRDSGGSGRGLLESGPLIAMQMRLKDELLGAPFGAA